MIVLTDVFKFSLPAYRVGVRRLLNISNKAKGFENSKTLAEEEVSCSVRMETTEYGGSVLLFFCNGKKVRS